MSGARLIPLLRGVSVTEAVSYLALLAATLVKETGGSETGVTVLGPIHGVLFLVFAALILACRKALGWGWLRTLAALVIGSLPLGGFYLERKWLAPTANVSKVSDPLRTVGCQTPFTG